MFNKFNEELGQSSNAKSSQKFSAAASNPFSANNPFAGCANNPFSANNPFAGCANNPFSASDPFAGCANNPFSASNPFSVSNPFAGCATMPSSMDTCLIMQTTTYMKSEYRPRVDEAEVMFGAAFPYPMKVALTRGPLISPLMPPEMRLKLLSVLDSCDATAIEVQQDMMGTLPEEPFDMEKLSAPLDKVLRKFIHIAHQFDREIKANQALYDAKGAPTEQELVDAYEKWQYEKRKELGEPVMFRNGQLCFEKYIFEAGYQPGPFPGLDLYTLNGQPVNPKAFNKWLSDTRAQRKERQNEYVGFFGCPACGLRAADMVWFYGQKYHVYGNNTYRACIKYLGRPPRAVTLDSIFIQNTLKFGPPLPCMQQD